MAGAIAEALGAEKLIYLTDVAGLLPDVDDPASLDPPDRRRPSSRRCIDDGAVTGGMIPKIAACMHAVGRGVGSAHILDGRVPHVAAARAVHRRRRRHDGHRAARSRVGMSTQP